MSVIGPDKLSILGPGKVSYLRLKSYFISSERKRKSLLGISICRRENIYHVLTENINILLLALSDL